MKVNVENKIKFNAGTKQYSDLMLGDVFYYEGNIYIKCITTEKRYISVNIKSGRVVEVKPLSFVLPLKDVEFNPNYEGLVLMD